MANYLELRQLLHELLLLFAIGEWWQDIQKDFKQVQTLSRHTGQCEDRSDTVDGGMEWTDEEASNRKQRLELPACNGELPGQERGQRAGVPLSYLLTLSVALSPLSVSQLRNVAHEAHPRAQGRQRMPGTTLHLLGPRHQQASRLASTDSLPKSHPRKPTEICQNWSGHTVAFPADQGSGVREAHLGDWANC